MRSLDKKNSTIDTENEPLYQKAKTLFQQQKYHQAEKAIQLLLLEQKAEKKAEQKTSQQTGQQAPNAIYFHFMAQIKATIGLHNEQIEYLTQALELKPNSSDYLIELAFAHLSLCNFAQAYKYAELIAINDNNNAQIYNLTAKVYHSLGDYNGSVAMLEKAIELDDANCQLFYDLGMMLTLCGKIKPSIDAYQESIRLDPDFGLAHAALTKARTATLNNNNIEQLQSLVLQHRNPWTGINLYHGLAKELDDLGKYRESFEALTRGKKRLRTLCPHNPNDGAENIKVLIAVYAEHAQEITDTYEVSKTDNEENSEDGSKIAPIFVTGMPRTGTTIVERILTNHKDVVTLGERNQLSALLKKQCNSPYSALIDGKVLDDNWSTINFAKLGQDYIKSVNYLAKDSQRFVDKLPLNILLAGVALRALPQAKIICLHRDPLDTIIGNYRQVFEQSSGTFTYTLDLHALANYVYEFRNLVSLLAKLFPSRFLVVNYETLVTEPLTQSKLLFDFCDLPWQDEYVNIHKNTAPIGTASAAQVQEPIHGKFMGRSNNYMFCLEEIKMAFEKVKEN